MKLNRNENISAPKYDIGRFIDSIPTPLNILTLGEEITSIKEEIVATKKDDTFNQLLLWSIIIVVMIVLLWYAFKMLKEEK